MPNKNYVAGRRLEYQFKKDWEAEGAIVLRTAGSHGLFDLVAINEQQGEITFIQCKRVTTVAAHNKLADDWAKKPPLNINANVFQALVVKVKGNSGYSTFWA